METDQYVVEIVSKTGLLMRRSAPRSKEAAETMADHLKVGNIVASGLFTVRVVPCSPVSTFPRLPCPKCGALMTNIVSMGGKELVNRVCEPCRDKGQEKEGKQRKSFTWGT